MNVKIPGFKDWMLLSEMTEPEKAAREVFANSIKTWFTSNVEKLSSLGADMDADSVDRIGKQGSMVSIENVEGQIGVPAISSKGTSRAKAFVRDKKGHVWTVEGLFKIHGEDQGALESVTVHKHHVVIKWKRNKGFYQAKG